MTYAIHLIIILDIWLILAIGLNLLAGYLGIVTMAHASYFAIGAYAYSLTSVVFHFGALPAFLSAIGLAAVLSLAVSVAAWRLQRDFMVLATLALQVTVYFVLRLWSDPQAPLGSWRNLTNGTVGISHIPRPEIFGAPTNDPVAFAVVASVLTCICAAMAFRLTGSPWGRRAMAMRDDELALLGLGKGARSIKAQAAMIACILAALAGALYAAYAGYLDPSSASLDQSILMLAMVVIGGLGTFRGPIIGALVVVGLPELLRFLSMPEAQAAPLRLIIFGAALVALIHVRPAGLAGRYRLDR